MRIDRKYQEKIETVRQFVRGGGIIGTLEQVREMFSYANRASAKLFLDKLVRDGFFTLDKRQYSPTENLTGYPLFESVRAGLPFTPESGSNRNMDIGSYLIDHPASTYLVRVKGDSMEDAGIMEGDVAVVDRSLSPKNGDIVIASIDGDVTIKYYERSATQVRLLPANGKYSPIIAPEGTELLGVVVWSIRKYQ